MESPRAETDTYRLIITRRNASEILVVPSGSGYTLPRVEIHPRQRLAEQLTAEIARAWGLKAYCLFVPSARTIESIGESRCALMESVRHNDTSPAGTRWMLRSAASGCCLPPEAGAIRESLRELDLHTNGERIGEFATPGWLRELFRWTEQQITSLGLRLTGSFRQLNASPTFSLIRLETDGRAVWFKATGEPNSHELRVTVALAQLFPRSVPQILGIHRHWNGWLSAEVAGTSLDDTADFSPWEHAAEEIAELQIASIAKTAELLETAQLRDLRLPRLAERIDPFLSRMNKLMAAQEKPSPVPLVDSEIRTLAEGLKESCALLESFRLPNTLGHIDFNPGNIMVSEDRCVFLDWAEACVTNPLLTFEYLREHMARSGIEKPAAGESLTRAYLRPWTSFYSQDELRRALALSPLIAVFAYAVGSDSWRSSDLLHNPRLAGYFRSLTRRMYREANRVAERSELCLS